MPFFKFLGIPAQEPEETGTIRKITRQLDALDPGIAKFHALFACILSRVAHVDLQISAKETKKIEEILITLGHLSPDLAVLVTQIAKVQNQILGGVENYLFTREFYSVSTRDQQEHLLECLFAVAAADENISNRESQEVRQIAEELKVEHQDFIRIRSQFREHLGVLRK